MTSEARVDAWGVLEHAVKLAQRGEEFVLATVVWREAPSSGQEGSRAIVMASGELFGWIGGACAEPVLVREALKALADGEPRLLALGGSDDLTEVPAGVTQIAISCQSDGALQIFIEPVVAVPHLVVVGHSPMARTLCELARTLGWKAEGIAGGEFATDAVSTSSIVVVATQGHGDEDVIEQALAAGPVYLGVVASRRRADALRGYLSDRQISQEVVDSIHAPIGLDLGPTTHLEVAVAVLAELVELRAAGALTGSSPIPAVAVAEAIDPICGMTVPANGTSCPLDVAGEIYYFCCGGCRDRFTAELEQTNPTGGRNAD